MVSNTISKSSATRAEWYLRGHSLLVQHEPCGFVRKGNAPVRPGRRRLHNLGVPITRSSWVDRTRRKYDHPAQKPADPVRRPTLNRTRRGWPTYNPFLGSSASGCRTDRALCPGVQLDAKYVDVMVQRWQTRNGETAKLSRLTAGPSRAVPKATCGTGNGAACWPARSGEALPAAARLVQRLAVDRADTGFENLHSAPAREIACGSAKFRSAASSHSRNAAV